MRILWLKTELLHPLDKGGKIRTYHLLHALARSHHITYLTLDDGSAAPDAGERAREYAQEVVRIPFRAPARRTLGFYGDLLGNLGSPLPYAMAKYRSRAFRAAVERLAGSVDLVVCDFLNPAVNVPARLSTPALLFQHNVEAEIWRRHAEVAGDPLTRAYFRGQWRRMLRFEREQCARFDRVVAVSEQDAAYFRERYGLAEVVAVPTGVDTDYFQPSVDGGRKQPEIVFTGSMDWMPNEEGIVWFSEAVLPRIQAEIPDATLSVVGRSPGPKVQALAQRPGVTVTGTVPDVRPYLARAGVFVVPLRVGGGTRLKIYEALATGAPVVSTTVGAEGLPLTPGEHFLLADDAPSLAAACVTLLRDRARALGLGAAGARYVRARFGWEQVADVFAGCCAGAIAAARDSSHQESSH